MKISIGSSPRLVDDAAMPRPASPIPKSAISVFRCVLFVLAAEAVAAPAGPVLSGLDAIASQPYAASAKVVEIRGERGNPQPKEWVFLLGDSTARGGVREVTVADGKITSERTPLRGVADVAGLAPLDTRALAVDADEVFRIAHKEAIKSELGFDWADYTLRTDPDSHVPVWTVKLYDHMGAPVGTARISAKGGTVVAPLQPDPGAKARAEATPTSKGGGLLGNFGKAASRAAKSTKDSTLHFLGTLQEEFVGERTIGPKDEE
ncbi:MAG: hypothetical protein WC003_12655 [Terrimicrobiaceae bacterium]